MRTSKTERTRAEQVSAAIDQLMREPGSRPQPVDEGDVGLLDTAQQLARLPALLGPVDPMLEQQVMRRIRIGESVPGRRAYARPGWAAAGLVAALLVVMLVTPLGRTAVASFLAVFNLGRTEVRITPVDTPLALSTTAAAESSAIQQSLTLAEAQAQVSFAIPQPSYLPREYRLRGVSSYSYPELPSWVPQPFFVELVYEDSGGGQFTLRVYPIVLGQQASISGLNLQAAPIQAVQDVDVGGQAGVLLQLGTGRVEAAWQEVVWEQDDLILALYGTDLSEADLLRIARSVR
jgi:hypothetical protein